MALSLNWLVIAEGVETAAQLEFLRERGCDQIQGYYLGRPMSPEALELFRAGLQPPQPDKDKRARRYKLQDRPYQT